jgi:hypothetical protein
MNSALHFIKLNDTFNGDGMYLGGANMFHQSVLYNFIVSNPIFSSNKDIVKDKKNLLYFECKNTLEEFYKISDNNKSILDTLSNELIYEIKNNPNVKILLTSLAESTDYDFRIENNIKEKLQEFGISSEKLLIIENNLNFLKEAKIFKVYNSLHFLNTAINVDINNKNVLGYKFEHIDKSELDNVRQYYFLSLNRNAQKMHRHFLILFLFSKKIINKTKLSVLRELSDIYSNIEFDDITYPIEDINKKVPIELDTINYKNKNSFETTSTINKKDYLDSYINIVTETLFENKNIFITEKIVKPILMYQPFIVMASSGYLKELKKFGFKTFHPYIDESYDDESDDILRLKKILNEVERLSNLSRQEIHNLYLNVKNICIYNKNYIIENKKNTNLLNEIKQIENEW